MKIQPIVEGHGEVEAVGVLLRRLRDLEGAFFQVEILRPIRRSRSEIVEESRLAKLIRTVLLTIDCNAFLILLDGDDDCPRDLAAQLQARATAEAGGLPCAVVVAQREFEAWFLAALESLQGLRHVRADAAFHPNPESVRGAKERLEAVMDRRYSETKDQPAFSALFDMAAAYRSCRSFRRLVSAFGQLAADGAPVAEWPPPAWLAPP